MIKEVRYRFENFRIEEKNNNLFVVPNSLNYSIEQRKIFSAMLNFGYINFELGEFSVTARQIVDFWDYAKSSVLSACSIDCFFEILNLGKPFSERIPSIKTQGAFHSNDFKMSVVWAKTDSSMFSVPIAYEQKGLKLYDLEYGEFLGSIYPEYFELYYLIDVANISWSTWALKDRYKFLELLEKHSKKRKIILPKNLFELLNKHKGESEI